MAVIDPRFLIDLKGKSFVLYAGLLDLASRSGLKSLAVRLLQVPGPENGHLAIAEATAEFEDGRRFVEIGDAGPQNLAAQMVPSSCRMAATRAKARVLRDALNVGVCSFEELPPAEDRGEPLMVQARPISVNGKDGATLDACEECGLILRPAQAMLSLKKNARKLCPGCQKMAVTP